jgi:hypothetical protein
VILHPRRYAWVATDVHVLESMQNMFTVVPSASVTTTAGAGTNEDQVFVVALQEAIVYAGPTTISMYPQVGSATGTVRTQARRYLAAVWRSPNAIAHLTGTGLVAPSL